MRKPRWGEGPTRFVFMFMCEMHLGIYLEALSKPLRGIDRPEGADEDWRPSLSEMMRQAKIAKTFAERNQPTTRQQKLVQVRAPHFTAGFMTDGVKVTEAAPILKYLIGKTEDWVRQYFKKKGWKASLVTTGDQG